MPGPLLTFLGSGDAFSSGGRLQSGILIETVEGGLLLDCGVTVLAALQNCRLSSESIDAVVISHLHGDHFGGLPFLLLEALFVTKRTKPLHIIGPPGIEEGTVSLCRILYPGALDGPFQFRIDYSLLGQEPLDHDFFQVRGLRASHGQHAAAHSLRVAVGGREIAYTGDTEWTQDLIPLAKDADLLICECCNFDEPGPAHLDYRTLERERSKLETPRIILTHTGPAIHAHADEIPLEIAHDGMQVQL